MTDTEIKNELRSLQGVSFHSFILKSLTEQVPVGANVRASSTLHKSRIMPKIQRWAYRHRYTVRDQAGVSLQIIFSLKNSNYEQHQHGDSLNQGARKTTERAYAGDTA